MNTRDLPTQYGTAMYARNQPSTDCAAVGILRAAGAIIMGKTAMPEFTFHVPDNYKPANPHDPLRTPGISSSGSAACVADFQCPISMGGQVGASLTVPASYTGIYTLKPSFNNISNDGFKVCNWTVDTLGFFARSVSDLALMADVFALREYFDPVTQPTLPRTRIAIVKTPMFTAAGPSTIAALTKTAAILKAAGATVDEVSLPHEFGSAESLRRLHDVVWTTESAITLLHDYRRDDSGRQLPDGVRAAVEGAQPTLKERAEAQDKWAELRGRIDWLAANYTVIIAPSATDVAPLKRNQDQPDGLGSDVFGFLWTQLHCPVIGIPAFTGAHGLPVGISLIAGRYQDLHLLRVAELLAGPLMDQGGWTMGGQLIR